MWCECASCASRNWGQRQRHNQDKVCRGQAASCFHRDCRLPRLRRRTGGGSGSSILSIGKTPRHIGWDNHSPPDPHGPLAAALEANGMY